MTESKENKFQYFIPAGYQISIRVNNDEIQELNDYYEYITGETSFTTIKDYFWKIFSKATQQVKPVLNNQKAIDALTDENKKLREKLTVLDASCETIQEDNHSLLEDITAADDRYKNLKNEFDALKESNETSIEELTEINGTYEQLKTDITELKDENNRLSEVLESVNSENEELQKHNANITEENQSLKAELAELSENPKIIEKPVEIIINKALTGNQIIVSFSDTENELIEFVSTKETKRMSKPITKETVLKQVFFTYLIKGHQDYFPFNNKDIKNILNKYSKPKQTPPNK